MCSILVEILAYGWTQLQLSYYEEEKALFKIISMLDKNILIRRIMFEPQNKYYPGVVAVH